MNRGHLCLNRTNMAGSLNSRTNIFCTESINANIVVGFIFLFSKQKNYEGNSFLVAKLENIKSLNALNSFRLFDLFRKLRTTFCS